jgi:hypothetical protein
MYFVHFMKNNEMNSNSESSSTHMAVSAFELPDFVSILQKQFEEIKICEFGHKLLRLKQSSYGTEEDHNTAAFWSKEHTDFLKLESLGVRPYQGAGGCYFIRFWMPRKNTTNYTNWSGRRISIRLGNCKLRKVLQEMYNEILQRIEVEAEE